MARRKETLWQVDFSLGSVRPEAVERDDVVLIEKSVKVARNTVGLASGQIEGRPGTAYVGETIADNGREVDFGAAGTFDLHIVPNGVVLYDINGAVAYQDLASPWALLAGAYGSFTFADLRFWVISDPDTATVIIGAKNIPTQAISRTASGWLFGSYQFATGPAGQLLQPYWSYYEGVQIRPSARSGAVTVTASAAIWTPSHAGMSIRYLDREIRLTGFVSPTEMNGTVVEEMPPTYRIGVAQTSGYQIGDAVEHDKLGGQGIITGISGTNITVLATSKYDGFDATASPKLVAPNAAQVIGSVTVVSPAFTYLWDVQMLSQVHGYAASAAKHGGRLFLAGFPNAPLAFAASVVGSISDFSMGASDGDGFVESLSADRGGEIRYVVSAEDLLFLSSKGLFYQLTRDGSAITPKTINPIHFSSLGCALVEPAVVDDGCVFADAVGDQIHAAILAGDAYRSWRTVAMARYHAHIPVKPIRLSATTSGSETAEQFIFAILANGTVAVCQWDRDETTISWRLWDTPGAFRAIYQCFGSMRCIADRIIAGVARRTRERFMREAVMDCSSWTLRSSAYPLGQAGVDKNGWISAFATHLIGHVATIYFEGWDLDDLTINGSGVPLDDTGTVLVYPDFDGAIQIGMPFLIEVVPWARRSARTQTGTREVKRIIQIYITVQATGVFAVNGISYGGYRVGEDLSQPPPFRDMQIKAMILGRVSYETVGIVRTRPGPFRLLRLGYRVVI